jgi:hypothetical protein
LSSKKQRGFVIIILEFNKILKELSYNFSAAGIYVGILCADVAKWFAIVYATVTVRMINSIERH